MLNLARTEFSLPFSGRVVSSNVAIGQYVMAGQTYGVVFDTSSLEVSASLVDRQLEWLMETDEPKINIRLTFLGKRHVYPGQLKRTASTLDVGTRFATVYFSFNDEIKELLPGVFAEIFITGTNMQDVMLLPSIALQSQGDVWRVTRNDTLELWRPEIIYMNDQEVVVKGMASEVRVVTSRISGATNGLKITTVSNSRNNEPE
jgi:multidrug efflux pump subunit AcrA (membrane-fusion protein)